MPVDRSGFDAFFVEHRDEVVRLAYVLCGDVQIAEEVAQEAFLRAYARWDERTLINPPGWVRTVAANLARSRWRRAAAELRALGRLGVSGTAGPQADLPAEAREFWAVVQRLPRRQALAVALHYGEDRSVAEVAALMGCAEGTVKTQLHRARRRLAGLLGPSSREAQVVREDR